jgi:aldehyde dehydrogenase (NAD+)
MTTLEEYHDDNFINGDWVKSLSNKKIEIVDPSTEEVWGTVPASSVEDIDAAVQAAHRAFSGTGWSDIGAPARAAMMIRLAEEFESRAERLAMIITSENGTGITETRQAAGHAGKLLRYYAGLADYVDQVDERPFPGVADQFTEVVRQPHCTLELSGCTRHGQAGTCTDRRLHCRDQACVRDSSGPAHPDGISTGCRYS